MACDFGHLETPARILQQKFRIRPALRPGALVESDRRTHNVDVDLQMNRASSDRNGFWLLSSLFGLIGGLCCMTPIVMVLLGLASISAANSLGNVLYGEYRWAFRAASLVFLIAAIVVYFRRRGICTLDSPGRRAVLPTRGRA